MHPAARRQTRAVKIGQVTVGGEAPVVVQSMTNTDTVDVLKTAIQCAELARAGSELVRIAPAVPAGPSSPAQACESKSFFAKPACMNEQCASPRFTSHPQCVELRERNRRRAEQEQRL